MVKVFKVYLEEDGSAEIFYMKKDGNVVSEKCDNLNNCEQHAVFLPEAHKTVEELVDVWVDYGVSSKEKEYLKNLYESLTISIPAGTDEFPFKYNTNQGSVRCITCGKDLECRVMSWSDGESNGSSQVWIHKDSPELDFFYNYGLNANLEISRETYPTPPRHVAIPQLWCPKCGNNHLNLEMKEMVDVYSCVKEDCDYYYRHVVTQ
jgi:transcription elongation factor Elf1